MTIENDETLQIFLEESLEHLADIENDFLAIEEAGADIDEDLINKVYRAAHSIKGGAGFMGLTNIKDLTHEMENILGKIRSREMVPNSEIVNVLLLAADAVRNLLNDVFNSNETDISEHITALRSISEGSFQSSDESEGNAVSNSGDVQGKNESVSVENDVVKTEFSDAREAVIEAREEGKYVYQVNIDLLHDIHEKGRNLLDFVKEMQQTGTILDATIDMDSVGDLDGASLPEQIPCIVLFATIFKPEDVNLLFEIDTKNIYEVNDDLTMVPIGKSDSQEQESESVDTATQQDTVSKGSTSDVKESSQHGQDDEKKGEAELPKQSLQKKPSKPASSAPVKSRPLITETSLRVHVSLLDSLMTLAGELVLSRNQLVQALSSGDKRLSEVAGQRINMITSELQEAIMLTRMQPIGNVFNKFPRVVRDLARNLGKEVELKLEGTDVELDKTIIEAIGDPLTHLVRNSVDHGIESPDERRQAGKKLPGTVILRAYHEAGQVNIEIIDDGKGLDRNMLAESAIRKELLTKEQIELMSDKEIMNLIFMPGFSTAKEITDVSGRGVGMDVVKTNLEKVGGVVDIDSQPGKGTTIRIKLPLTLAIIPCQIISTGGERYAIPQVNLEELLRIPAKQVKYRVEKVGDADVVRLRGKLLPLVRLADLIGVEGKYIDPETGELKTERRKNLADRRSKDRLFQDQIDHAAITGQGGMSQVSASVLNSVNERRYSANSALNIVVVSTGSLTYGLVVDSLHDSEEIVVKPLGRHLKCCKGYAGATIMGDGRVALILDVAGLAKMARFVPEEGLDPQAETSKQEKLRLKDDEQTLLIFRNAVDEQFTVPLSLVSRIEKIKRSKIENVGGKTVIQYRGTSLPLVTINDVANVKPLADKEDLLVIVFTIAGREIGLMATDPVDAVNVSVRFDEATLRQPGIMGSAIIDDCTTQMVDIFGLVEAVNPEWFSERKPVENEEGSPVTILYAEDSKFFRSQVKSFMEGEGYHVIEAEDGMIAWNILQEHADEISLVVTDIEMPNLDGLGLARKIKGDERFSYLPIIAMTTLASDEDIKRGKEAGIDDYQIKLDKEKLLDSLYEHLRTVKST